MPAQPEKQERIIKAKIRKKYFYYNRHHIASAFKISNGGSLGGVVVWRLPSAQGAILETRDRVPRRAPVSLRLSLSL